MNEVASQVGDLEDFNKMKGLFSVQEYIQELIRDNPSDIQKIISLPKKI